MDDNHDNFMANIIASGTNTIATFTDEECSQADMYLNIPPNEDDAASGEDTAANIEDNSLPLKTCKGNVPPRGSAPGHSAAGTTGGSPTVSPRRPLCFSTAHDSLLRAPGLCAAAEPVRERSGEGGAEPRRAGDA
jgi:hypothetical protein